MGLTHEQSWRKRTDHDDTVEKEMPGRGSGKQRDSHPDLLQPFHIKLVNPCQTVCNMDNADAIAGMSASAADVAKEAHTCLDDQRSRNTERRQDQSEHGFEHCKHDAAPDAQ